MIVQQYSEDIDDYKHYGVIVGWHYRCRYMMMEEYIVLAFPNLFNENSYKRTFCECKTSMYKKHAYFKQQPHYILLVNNNELYYAGQYDISMCESPKMICNNVEIARYFTGFAGTHYIANKRLSREYPYDDAELRKILANQ
ncbi:hypothetical protein ACFW04_008313 [Cataglyphis niger]